MKRSRSPASERRSPPLGGRARTGSPHRSVMDDIEAMSPLPPSAAEGCALTVAADTPLRYRLETATPGGGRQCTVQVDARAVAHDALLYGPSEAMAAYGAHAWDRAHGLWPRVDPTPGVADARTAIPAPRSSMQRIDVETVAVEPLEPERWRAWRERGALRHIDYAQVRLARARADAARARALAASATPGQRTADLASRAEALETEADAYAAALSIDLGATSPLELAAMAGARQFALLPGNLFAEWTAALAAESQGVEDALRGGSLLDPYGFGPPVMLTYIAVLCLGTGSDVPLHATAAGLRVWVERGRRQAMESVMSIAPGAEGDATLPAGFVVRVERAVVRVLRRDPATGSVEVQGTGPRTSPMLVPARLIVAVQSLRASLVVEMRAAARGVPRVTYVSVPGAADDDDPQHQRRRLVAPYYVLRQLWGAPDEGAVRAAAATAGMEAALGRIPPSPPPPSAVGCEAAVRPVALPPAVGFRVLAMARDVRGGVERALAREGGRALVERAIDGAVREAGILMEGMLLLVVVPEAAGEGEAAPLVLPFVVTRVYGLAPEAGAAPGSGLFVARTGVAATTRRVLWRGSAAVGRDPAEELYAFEVEYPETRDESAAATTAQYLHTAYAGLAPLMGNDDVGAVAAAGGLVWPDAAHSPEATAKVQREAARQVTSSLRTAGGASCALGSVGLWGWPGGGTRPSPEEEHHEIGVLSRTAYAIAHDPRYAARGRSVGGALLVDDSLWASVERARAIHGLLTEAPGLHLVAPALRPDDGAFRPEHSPLVLRWHDPSLLWYDARGLLGPYDDRSLSAFLRYAVVDRGMAFYLAGMRGEPVGLGPWTPGLVERALRTPPLWTIGHVESAPSTVATHPPSRTPQSPTAPRTMPTPEQAIDVRRRVMGLYGTDVDPVTAVARELGVPPRDVLAAVARFWPSTIGPGVGGVAALTPAQRQRIDTVLHRVAEHARALA